jgi:carboxymethylenebutenolidase
MHSSKILGSNQLIRILLFTALVANTAILPAEKFTSSNHSVAYEVFGAESNGPILILLHGTGGPYIPFYPQQAAHFANRGFTVLLLHYFDSSATSTPSTANYTTWVEAVDDLIEECHKNPKWAKRKIALIGFSLGSSVALAAGSQGAHVDAIAEWYGSLPDAFFESLKGMPPLLILHGQHDDNIPIINAQQLIRLCEMKKYTCESHIYPDQFHGFHGDAVDDANRRTVVFLTRMLK